MLDPIVREKMDTELRIALLEQEIVGLHTQVESLKKLLDAKLDTVVRALQQVNEQVRATTSQS